MSTVEGYDLHVYCDDPEHVDIYSNEYQDKYYGHTRAAAYRAARAEGWKFSKKVGTLHGGKFATCKACQERGSHV